MDDLRVEIGDEVFAPTPQHALGALDGWPHALWGSFAGRHIWTQVRFVPRQDYGRAP